MLERRAAGAAFARLALAVAAWLHYLRGVDEAGRKYAVDDPHAQALKSLLLRAGKGSGARAAVLLGYAPVFGTLGQDEAVVSAVEAHWQALQRDGVLAVLARLG